MDKSIAIGTVYCLLLLCGPGEVYAAPQADQIIATPSPEVSDTEGPPPPVPPAVITRDAAGRATERAIRLTEGLHLDGN